MLIASDSENKEDELIENIEQKRSKQTPTTTWVGFQIRCLAKDHLGFCSVISLWLGVNKRIAWKHHTVDFLPLRSKKSTDPSLVCCCLFFKSGPEEAWEIFNFSACALCAT